MRPGDGAPERTYTFGSTESPSAAGATAAPSAWRRIADIPAPRSEVAAAAFRGVVYVVGGSGGGDVVETYVADRWTRGPDLPTPRHGLGVVAVGSTLYVMRGRPTAGGSQTPVCEALDVR